MLVEGLLLWSKVVSVNISEDRRMKLYYIIGWGKTHTHTRTDRQTRTHTRTHARTHAHTHACADTHLGPSGDHVFIKSLNWHIVQSGMQLE